MKRSELKLPSIIRSLFLFLFLLTASPLLAQEFRADPDMLLRHALAHQQAGNVEAARRIAREILSSYPDYHDARILLGRTDMWGGKFREAHAHFDSVLAFSPDYTDARFAKAQAFALDENYSRSLQILNALAAENESKYQEEYAKALLWSRDYELALREYEKAHAIDPLSSEVIRGLARSSYYLLRFEESLDWYQLLLKSAPRDTEAQASISRLSFLSKNELHLSSSVESFARGATRHLVNEIEFFRMVDWSWKVFLHFGRSDKFGSLEHRFGGGAYWNVTSSSTLFTQVIVSPNSVVVPRIDTRWEWTQHLGEGIEGDIQYRFLSFARVKSHVLSPGVSYYFNDRLWMNIRSYASFNETSQLSRSFVGTVYLRPDRFTLARVGAFGGNEIENATTVDEITRYQSMGMFLSGKRRINTRIAGEATYRFVSRKPLSASHFISLGVQFLF